MLASSVSQCSLLVIMIKKTDLVGHLNKGNWSSQFMSTTLPTSRAIISGSGHDPIDNIPPSPGTLSALSVRGLQDITLSCLEQTSSPQRKQLDK